MIRAVLAALFVARRRCVTRDQRRCNRVEAVQASRRHRACQRVRVHRAAEHCRGHHDVPARERRQGGPPDLHPPACEGEDAGRLRRRDEGEQAGTVGRRGRWPERRRAGQTIDATVTLDAGNYIMVCWVPSPGVPVPHMAKGMIKSLAVTAPSGVTQAGAWYLPESAPDVHLELSEYAFKLSKPLTAGKHTIHVMNTGTQEHEAGVGEARARQDDEGARRMVREWDEGTVPHRGEPRHGGDWARVARAASRRTSPPGDTA